RQPDRRHPGRVRRAPAERRQGLMPRPAPAQRPPKQGKHIPNKPENKMRSYPPAILDRKIRFALVGCGRIAKNHMNAIREHHDRAELVGVCDVDPRALESAAGATRARAWRSLD